MATMELTMDEAARAAQLGVKYIVEHVSLRKIIELSYEGGGVYPTLVGYALGSIAALFFARAVSWIFRFVPAALCLMLLLHTLHGLERKSLEWLLMIAAATGVCCTYVQLASLDLVRDHIASDKLSKSKAKLKKND
ncbi:hypothetical protein PRIC1_009102 [Phytophthora ramorum]|uniref:Uncharacterized protein n=1 Tax=Phytophthora ramorum TaxID=164328 RepID=H3H2Z4_PHYRM|nr:hypothetical protein KRP23_6145 [Phytophthora ramorum]KAH7505051.1 hypothetical protein KRP22_5527 [Phytophthora ramorum]